MTKLSLRSLQLAAAVTVFGTLITVGATLAGTGRLNHVSGVWITLAVDLTDGVFYRPLFGPQGYGGTRFFPLHFLLHAGLIRAGFAAVVAGYVVTFASAAGMIGALYAWLRRLAVPPRLAVPLTLLGLASAASGLAVTTIRGDLLPAALNLWGLCLCTPNSGSPSRRQLLAAAACFVLAFAAKVTTVFGCAAAIVALLSTGRSKQARLLAGLSISSFIGVLLLLHFASAGRATESLIVCASGGATLADVLEGPVSMLANAASRDLVSLAAILLAGAALVQHHRNALNRLPGWALGATALLTAVIFGSPGTDYNHLLDLYLVCLVVLGTLWSKPVPSVAWMAPCLSLVVIAGCVMNGLGTLRTIDRIQASRTAILQALRDQGPPAREQLLSQDPMVPLLLGARPFLMDPFMLRLSRLHDPRITADLWSRLERHDFTAIVLMVDPTSPEGIARLRDRHFGPGFARHLAAHYALQGRYGMYYLYRPQLLEPSLLRGTDSETSSGTGP